MFLDHFFGEKKLFHQFDPTNTPKCYTWLESYGSAFYDGKEKKLFFSPCEASDFRGRTSTDFQTLAETVSYPLSWLYTFFQVRAPAVIAGSQASFVSSLVSS